MSNPQQLRYVADIVDVDIDAIEAFLTTRTAEQLVAHHPDTTEHKMACAVEWMLQSAAFDARYALEKLAAPEEQYRALELRRDLKNGWNLLVNAATPWRQTPGHDADRWRRVTHTSEEGQGRPEGGK
ncbi:hypothetical protein ACFTWH_10820 [Streptomyces sp. NPDC057011]|uniref:hypothetical protein n=1 Tax=unclassified Streptomyces TaxID=2593676 RepID=UPI003625135C